ncbi:hypothetical protein AB0K52_22490 [Glycomyces sp. NPDC049804]|uniref:hypothetical protein n=1 Tax=Glycomyces sp. NPDC049804 TaxID=3154363 RepID=UPI003420C1D1
MHRPPPEFARRTQTSSLRGIMFAYQAHSWQRLGVKLGKLTTCSTFPPRHGDYKNAVCPFCIRARDYEDLAIEHAPQEGGQSRLGPWAMRFLSCEVDCNQHANRAFEQAASIEDNLIRQQPVNLSGTGLCDIHAPTGYFNGELIVPPDEDRRFLVDLKAGFSLGFTALGYRWSAAHELAPIREAIATAIRPSHRRAIMVRLPPGSLAVLDVASPFRSTIIRGRNGISLMLPTVDAPTLPITDDQYLQGRFAFGPVQYQAVPWPARPKTKADVERLFLRGHLFHYDTCPKHLPGYY